MFCPKCGAESIEDQRFCKACGTNLQLIHSALKGGGSGPQQLGFDVEALKQQAIDFASSFKTAWGPHAGRHVQHRVAREIRRKARDEARRRNLPRPSEWMRYSWQHNLKSGLSSLLGGAGLGVLFYYLGKTAIDSGAIQSAEDALHGNVHGLAALASMVWLFALIPVLKGVGQIFYAAFFAESMATLSDRFTVKPEELEEHEYVQTGATNTPTAEPKPRTTEPQSQDWLASPPSVTEHTTRTFDEARAQQQRESS